MTDLPSVAWLGLGNMGAPMSARLVAAGYPVTGFDLSADARAGLEAAGGSVATEAAAAVAGARIVILMLPSSGVVESVLEGDGVLAAIDEGALVVDMGSSEPLRTRRLAGVAADRGVRLIDAPVSGGVTGAENGTLTIMAGGAPDDYAEALPLLEVLGRPTHVGTVGAGHALKALNNLMSAIHLWGSSEAILTAIRFGLDVNVLLDVVNVSSGRSGSTQNKWPNFIVPGGYDSGFGLRLMLKDMKIGADLAEAMGVPRVLSDEAVRLWQQAADELPATADHTEVARWLQEHSADLPADPSGKDPS